MICCTCKEDKPETEFGRNKSRPNGLQPNCHACRRACGRRWRKNATPEMLAKEYQRTRMWRVQKSFGLSPTEYAALIESQQNRCAVCGLEETRESRYGKTHALDVDHDHRTGKVRALLCHRCNVVLGLVNDGTELLHSLAAYVRHHEEE